MSEKLKILSISLLAIFFTSYLLFAYMDESLPEGTSGPEAEVLAQRMLKSINHEAWLKSGVASWGFDDREFVWDRKRHLTEVNYQGHRVQLDIDKRTGIILKTGEAGLTEERKKEICLWAWKYWCNDSFWLNPISKIFDPGTERRLVDWKGQPALLVTYTSGGSTPGDSYLWILDENGRPKSWKLWVSIIPIGGMNFTWDEWIELDTGVKISTQHFNPVKTIRIHYPIVKNDLIELTGKDIFAPLFSGQKELISF